MSEKTTALVVRSLDEIETQIGQRAATGRRALQEIAVLVHEAHKTHFPTVPAWVDWCRGIGYEKRMAYQLAKVGRTLVELHLLEMAGPEEGVHSSALAAPHYQPLLDCGLKGIEDLANLRDAKPDQFDGLLKHWSPAGKTCKEIAAKVRTYLGPELHTLRCEDCRKDFEASEAKRKRCVDCEEKHAKKLEADKERRKEGAFDKAVCLIAGLWDQDDLLKPLVGDLAPGMAHRAAMTLLDLVGAHVREYRDLDRDQMQGVLKELDKAVEQLRTLTAEAAD